MTLATNADSTNVLALANTPLLWVLAFGVFAVIIVQTLIYVRAARKVAPEVGMSSADLRTSFRTGAITSIGPSLAVALVAVALLAIFGTPATLMRIGLIGSVSFETGAAAIAAGTMGAELGGPTYTQEVFAVAFTAMSLGGAMWILSTLILTPILKRGDSKMRQVSPLVMTIIPGAALLGAFFSLGFAELPKSGTHVIAFITSALVVGICLFLSARLHRRWIREWSLGFAIIAGLAMAYTSTQLQWFPAA
ncbi:MULTISPECIES: DUF5058 family protein [Citricoccus]|uniref:DUF5058 family protein n=1 Tax=Citricoccus muralis TaxID=169134 RepID=A0ABY8H8C6_9MICC|nr:MULTISPECIES: DUF5058 family protein [Citricoccus]WBL19506.1 DUF5058 family protein [Citricoccus sp. NR2]WFP16908.1 DUF5058 family protein [Citricoccus muralis]